MFSHSHRLKGLNSRIGISTHGQRPIYAVRRFALDYNQDGWGSIQLKSHLGGGAYGDVFHGVDGSKGNVTVKIIRNVDSAMEEYRKKRVQRGSPFRAHRSRGELSKMEPDHMGHPV